MPKTSFRMQPATLIISCEAGPMLPKFNGGICVDSVKDVYRNLQTERFIRVTNQ